MGHAVRKRETARLSGQACRRQAGGRGTQRNAPPCAASRKACRVASAVTLARHGSLHPPGSHEDDLRAGWHYPRPGHCATRTGDSGCGFSVPRQLLVLSSPWAEGHAGWQGDLSPGSCRAALTPSGGLQLGAIPSYCWGSPPGSVRGSPASRVLGGGASRSRSLNPQGYGSRKGSLLPAAPAAAQWRRNITK